jgi:glutathione S-transferase
MKLYWGKHTCAIGIHMLLEEIGKPYETERIDVGGGDTHQPLFLAVNPKGKVPTLLRDDGSVLTEFTAIAVWLALTNPTSNLWPDDPEQQARALEVLAYVEGTVHGQGYARIFKPEAFEPQDLMHETLGLGQSAVKKQGQLIVEMGFAILDPQLGRHRFAAGASITVADFALFYAEHWAKGNAVTLPINIEAHYQRMLSRRAVHSIAEMYQ